MLLGTLDASLLRNILAEKGINRAGEGIVRAGYGNKKGWKARTKKLMGLLILRPPLTNFEIQMYYQNQPRFNGLYLRDNLPRIRDGTYIINLDE